MEKEEKKKDPIILNKKIEGREKEGTESFFYSFSFLSPLKNERKMEKEREENTYSQGQRKEKDLASSFDETRSKTMRFCV